MKKISNSLLEKKITKWGAILVGFADLQGLVPEPWTELTTGVSFAIRLSDAIIDEVITGPTLAYAYHYRVINQFLDSIALKIVKDLQSHGYHAFPVPASQKVDKDALAGHFSHKLVATRAGLGWIGKSALLVTPQHGPRIRLCSILTNAPLKPGTPVTISECGQCTACVKACPVNAIQGNSWTPQSSRSNLLNAQLCSQVTQQSKEKLGELICGVCISACPIGKNIPK